MRPTLTGLTLTAIGVVGVASLAINGVVLARQGTGSTSSIPAQIENESGAEALGARVGGGGGGRSSGGRSGGGGESRSSRSSSRASESRSSSRASESRSSERRPSVERRSERRPSVERPSSRPNVERPSSRPSVERPSSRPSADRPSRRPSIERPSQLPEVSPGDRRPGLERPVQPPEPGDRRQELRDRLADRLDDRLPDRIIVEDDDDDDDTAYVFLDQQFLTDRVLVVLASNVAGARGDVEIWLNNQMDPPVLVANALVDGLRELATYTLCVDSLLVATGKSDEQGSLFLEGAVRFTGGIVSGLTVSIHEGGGCNVGVSMHAVMP